MQHWLFLLSYYLNFRWNIFISALNFRDGKPISASGAYSREENQSHDLRGDS
jgi:hypothetical protein